MIAGAISRVMKRMDPSPSPARLVQRAQAGDRDAFAALYDATSRALFLYVVGIVGRTDDAEDFLHTSYLAAWERLRSLRQPAQFSAWLFRIGRNAARDVVRRGRHWDSLRSTLRDDKPVRDSGAVDDGHRVPVLDGLLEGLQTETRALLLLRHGLEWSVEQIAAALGESTPTVRRHLAEAHQHLRRRHEGRLAHGR